MSHLSCTSSEICVFGDWSESDSPGVVSLHVDVLPEQPDPGVEVGRRVALILPQHVPASSPKVSVMRDVVSVGATYQAARMRVAISCTTMVHENDIQVCD